MNDAQAQRTFDQLRGRMARRYPVLASVRLRLTDKHFLARPAARDLAWYEDGVVTVLRKALRGPKGRLEGLLAHELGHAADPDTSKPYAERRADAMAKAALGVPVRYDVGDVQNLHHGVTPRPARLHENRESEMKRNPNEYAKAQYPYEVYYQKMAKGKVHTGSVPVATKAEANECVQGMKRSPQVIEAFVRKRNPSGRQWYYLVADNYYVPVGRFADLQSATLAAQNLMASNRALVGLKLMSSKDYYYGRKRNPALKMGEGQPWLQGMERLRSSKLYAKSNGSLEEALLSAGYYAKKNEEPIYMYAGNSYGFAIWRTSRKKSDALDPINNTGNKIIVVLPDLTVTVHPVEGGRKLPKRNPAKGYHMPEAQARHTAEGLLARMKADGADTFAKKIKWVKTHMPNIDRPRTFVGWVTKGERGRVVLKRNPSFSKWLDTFLEEKEIDMEDMLTVKGKTWGTNYMPVGVVVRAMKMAPKHEQDAIKTMLVKIDFANAPVRPYLAHLAQAIAR